MSETLMDIWQAGTIQTLYLAAGKCLKSSIRKECSLKDKEQSLDISMEAVFELRIRKINLQHASFFSPLPRLALISPPS